MRSDLFDAQAASSVTLVSVHEPETFDDSLPAALSSASATSPLGGASAIAFWQDRNATSANSGESSGATSPHSAGLHLLFISSTVRASGSAQAFLHAVNEFRF